MFLWGVKVWSGTFNAFKNEHIQNRENRNCSVYALDELLLHHAVEGDVGQVRNEGVAGPSADALTASEVQQSQRGEALQVGQTAISQLAATWTQADGQLSVCLTVLSSYVQQTVTLAS